MGKKRRQNAPKASEEALDTLVGQFSQPLAFLRELIQNSLDARTNKIEVEVDYEPAEGCARVQVTDWGEGMNREVIESQLTRLFSSSKEGDLTSIGKFGIGFVSVFATKPKAVVVDTGKDGEYWRVLFREDRTFELLSRHEPIEGTRVTSFIPVTQNKLARLQADCRETVEFWCKHCDVDILFNGRKINQEFALGLPGEVSLEVPGSHVVAAPSPSPRPFAGFYNRGLTLHEGEASPRPGVTFKLRSMYLEHTLTRDSVLVDKNYHKALAVLDRAIGQIPRKLLGELAHQPEDRELWTLANAFFAHQPRLPADCLEIAIFPSHGGQLSFRQLINARRVGFHDRRDPLVESLLEQGVVVLPDQPEVLRLARLKVQPVPVRENWFLARAAAAEGDLEALLGVATRLLPGPRLQGGIFEHCGPRGQCLSLMADTPGQAEPVSGSKKHRLINLEHPMVEDLAGVVRHDASLAGYLLGRAVLLESGQNAERKMLEAAFKLRRSS